MARVRKPVVAGFITLAAAASLTAVVLAANPHFVVGPSITISGGVATACGKIAGLGNNQKITIVITATATTTCTNRGGNVPPGQTETVSGTTTVTSGKNGTVSFCVSTGSVTNPCPSPMTPRTSFTDFSIRVYDAAGNQILP